MIFASQEERATDVCCVEAHSMVQPCHWTVLPDVERLVAQSESVKVSSSLWLDV